MFSGSRTNQCNAVCAIMDPGTHDVIAFFNHLFHRLADCWGMTWDLKHGLRSSLYIQDE